MILILNFGRLLMVAWLLYAILLMFAPHLLNQPSSRWSGVIQAAVAFIVGNLLDRAVGALRRRKAQREGQGEVEAS
jgi:hypothetical protein